MGSCGEQTRNNEELGNIILALPISGESPLELVTVLMKTKGDWRSFSISNKAGEAIVDWSKTGEYSNFVERHFDRFLTPQREVKKHMGNKSF
mmetsp:Transcript_8208/g.16611  ORF Transcript_8208/g.16611 Transcript_8208/m.16611 type:complete len:92 (+) Transcript_8208:715-990(+)